MFNEIRSNVFFPGGRQGAVREPLHPDTLKVPEHAHASGCAWAATILLVGDSPSDESHHHLTVPSCASHEGAAPTTMTTMSSLAYSSFTQILYLAHLAHLQGAVRCFLGVSWRAQQRSQPSRVIIRPLSSCRHLLRRSRSDLFLSPPPSVPMTPPLYRLRHNSPARALSIYKRVFYTPRASRYIFLIGSILFSYSNIAILIIIINQIINIQRIEIF